MSGWNNPLPNRQSLGVSLRGGGNKVYPISSSPGGHSTQSTGPGPIVSTTYTMIEPPGLETFKLTTTRVLISKLVTASILGF